ncbi:MAG TPA: hypothetical protein VF733_05200 [Candidatus Saccharimonadales bacterium]
MRGWGYELGTDYEAPTSADLDILGAHRLAPACLLLHANNPHWMDADDFYKKAQMALGVQQTDDQEALDLPSREDWERARRILAADERVLETSLSSGAKQTVIGGRALRVAVPLAGAILGWQVEKGMAASFWADSETTLSNQLAGFRNLGAVASGSLAPFAKEFYARIISLQGSRAREQYAEYGSEIIGDPALFSQAFVARRAPEVSVSSSQPEPRPERRLESQTEPDPKPAPRSPPQSPAQKPRPDVAPLETPVPSPESSSPSRPPGTKKTQIRRLLNAHVREAAAEVSLFELQPQLRDDLAGICYDSLAMATLLILAKNPAEKTALYDLRMSLIEHADRRVSASQVKYSIAIKSLRTLARNNMIDLDEAAQQAVITPRGIEDGVPLVGVVGNWMTSGSSPMSPEDVFLPKVERLRFDLLNVLTASGGTVASVLKVADVLGQDVRRVYRQLSTLFQKDIVDIYYVPGGRKDIAKVELNPACLPPLQRLMEGILSLQTKEGKEMQTSQARLLTESPEHFHQLVLKRFSALPSVARTERIQEQGGLDIAVAADKSRPLKDCPETLFSDFDAIGTRPLAMASLLASFARRKVWMETGQLLWELQRLSDDRADHYPQTSTLHDLAVKMAGSWGFCNQKPGRQNRISIQINQAGIERALPLIGAIADWQKEETEKYVDLILPYHSNKASSLLGAYEALVRHDELDSSKALGKGGNDHLARILAQRGVIEIEYGGKMGTSDKRIASIRLVSTFKDSVLALITGIAALGSEAGRIEAVIQAYSLLSDPKQFARLIRF